ncbi:hypothetical protein WA158_002348 [Blastocystis sp. Blastoise]
MSLRLVTKPLALVRNVARCNTVLIRSFSEDTYKQKGLTPEMIEKIKRRDHDIREEYYSLNGHFDNVDDPSQGKVTYTEAFRKRLVFRSKQRGMLEVDLLLGKWATEFVPTLNQKELDQYQLILNSETNDIFAWITSRSPVPPEIDSPVMKRIQKWVKSAPFGYADPKKYAEEKKFFTN